MKNDCNLPEIRDLTAVPSDELNARTLAAMEQVIQRKTKKKMPLARRITVCAALFCAALVLMGAGVRLYEHLTFVPGMGVVTVTEPAEPEKEVFTLARVVETEAYRIEAVSMIPAEDEEHAGMWEVTVLTDQADSDSSMTLYGKDNVPYTLTCAEDEFQIRIHTPATSLGMRYSGYVILDSASETDEYRLNWKNTDCILPLKSLKDSVWANYSYPVSDGITAIVFPMAEGSQYLVFDIIFEPQSENMAYWFSHCYTSFYITKGVAVTDTLGNTYQIAGQSQRAITLGQDYDVNSLIHYPMETILVLDTPLTAEIAEIVIDSIEVQFQVHENVGGYLVKIPEPGEAVPAEDLPDGGVFFDQHGIRIPFDEITTRISEQDTYEIVFRRGNPIEWDFEENVTDITIFPSYYEPDKSSERMNIYTGSYSSEKNPETGSRIWYYTMPFHGAGDLKKIGLPLTFGDEVQMFINNLRLTIAGNWHIDFTAEKTD
ncbi:MAG: hypothetical protein II333_02150 [Clostridia bacterium]|nr:hypothetical protein [Clostridia bacterium]